MNTFVRLGAYAGGLAVAFGAAFAVGAAADPITAIPKTTHAASDTGDGMDGMDESTSSHKDPAAEATDKALPGLAVSRDGYTLVAATTTMPAGRGDGLTLGTDIAVAGDFTPVVLPVPATHAVVDGYDVALDGAPVAGREAELTFTITRDSSKVTALQPYLGAFGHLVSLRTGDLAYLHTHPADDARAGERGGPAVRFVTEFPTAGSYRLFLDFRTGGAVHTAEFTVTVAMAGATGAGVRLEDDHDSDEHGQ